MAGVRGLRSPVALGLRVPAALVPVPFRRAPFGPSGTASAAGSAAGVIGGGVRDAGGFAGYGARQIRHPGAP